MTSPDADELWRCVQQADCMQSLIRIVENAGYHPVLLKKRLLLRSDCNEENIPSVLGQLSAFGCLADKDNTEGQELTNRELQLVQLGVRKSSINRLLRGLQHARNVSKAVCLVVDCRPAAPDAVARPIVEARHVASGDFGATVFFGVGDAIARVDAQLPADPVSSDATSDAGDSDSPDSDVSADADTAIVAELLQQQQRKSCEFSDVTLVAYEPCGLR